MWRAATDNEFVLKGAFKDLLCTALEEPITEFQTSCDLDPDFLRAVYDENEEDPEWVFSTAWHYPFERFANRDKILLLARTLRALTSPDMPPPELTQNNESAVYAMFEALSDAIELEIDTTKESRADGFDPYIVRRQVALVEREYLEYEDADDYIEHTNTDISDWRDVVEGLSNVILWDSDFIEDDSGTAVSGLADQNPEIARRVKEHLGIDQDYYAHPIEPATYDEFVAEVNYLFTTVLEPS